MSKPNVPRNSSDDITVKQVVSASLEDLIRLYKDAGWWEPAFDQNPQFLNEIVKDSSVFIGAFEKDRLIGMGRALSDMVSDAYIQDVVVLKDYRGRGIGRRIIQALIKKLEEKGVDWIGVVAEPGTESFYHDLGFGVLNKYTPMKYTPDISED